MKEAWKKINCSEAHPIALEAMWLCQEKDSPPFQCLFDLVGLIRGRYRGAVVKPEEGAEATWHIAWDLARMMGESPSGYWDFTRWRDSDAVKLEYLEAWRARREVMNSPNLGIAIDISQVLECFGELKGDNYWVWRVTMVGLILQELQPHRPFFIPVNEEVAKRLGTSIRTLSLAINRALEWEYLLVVEQANLNPKRRRARKLKFNYERDETQEEMIAGTLEVQEYLYGDREKAA
jgi:hypothetical protein